MEEVVSSLNLVPVEQMPLTELHILQIKLFDKRLPCYIKAGKQPAPSRALLISDRLTLCLHFLVVDVDSIL